MSEQPPINFDEDNNVETNHEVFTNLPNNTLNGVNPIGIEDKTDVMENLVEEVKKEGDIFGEEITPVTLEESPVEPEIPETNEITFETASEPEVEMPATAEVEMPSVNENTVVEEPMVEQSVVEETPVASVVDNVINESGESEVAPIEVNETPVVPKNNAKKVRIIVFVSILALAIGGLLLCLFLVLPKPQTPAGASSNSGASGTAGIEASDFTSAKLSEFNNTYLDGTISEVTEETTLRKLSDGTNDVFVVLKNGTIGIVDGTDSRKYTPLVFQENNIIYYYSFVADNAYYFVSTDGNLFKIESSKDENGYIKADSISMTLVASGVDTVSAKKGDANYEVQLVKENAETEAFTNVTNLDKTVTNV